MNGTRFLQTFFLFFILLNLFHFNTPPAFAIESDSSSAASPEVSKDIYYQTDGPVSGPPAPKMSYPETYGREGLIDSRSLLWIFIQQHFFLGSFILGVPMIAWMIELFSHLRRRRYPEQSEKQDRLARDIMEIGMPFYPISIFFGVALLGAFLFLYNQFFKYMAGLFRPVVYLYAICFVLESLLLYSYTLTWGRWTRGDKKWFHLSLGALTCTNGVIIVCLANAWMAFMMSPAGIDAEGRYLGDVWKIIHTPLWNPLNVHRILASIMFSGAVIAAYAAYRTLTTRDPAKRAHYDWMGHVTMMIAIVNLFLLPFAGYWFAKVIFIFRQRMGVTLMGGQLSWPFVIQAMLIGLIFMTVTFYLWKGTARMNGADRYTPYVKYLLVILTISFLIWTTPHTLPASQSEFKEMGGSQHPIVGYYGTMAAKNTAINTMILTFGLCFILFQRCNKRITVAWSRWGNAALIVLFGAAEVIVLYLGIYGFYVPASVRVGLAFPQFMAAMTGLIGGYFLNLAMLRGAESLGPIRWGRLPLGGALALFFLAVFITMTMSLMGYIRSSVRLNWHITEVMQDVTPWAQTPSITYAVGMVLLNVAIFWLLAVLIFWAGSGRKVTLSARTSDEPAELAKTNESLPL
ncbi:MAG: cytochrome ubiquinol oxidase subunit I [Nitrospirae bacterium]|nr:cytochrome ubiquinol oxidase subunit I [Candidatus Manganitrophaceae bacterium]